MDSVRIGAAFNGHLDTMKDDKLIKSLQDENRRLINLLEKNGIQWQMPSPSARSTGSSQRAQAGPSREEKLALFGGLFRGRNDVFPDRWESSHSGKMGYSPVCQNDKKPGVCRKPNIEGVHGSTTTPETESHCVAGRSRTFSVLIHAVSTLIFLLSCERPTYGWDGDDVWGVFLNIPMKRHVI